MLECDECDGTSARRKTRLTEREGIAKLSRNRPLRTNVAWATCQTNVCKVKERRKSFAAENRCNIVERRRCACITDVGRLKTLHRNISQVSTRVSSNEKKKK